jgi:hypothetical protein
VPLAVSRFLAGCPAAVLLRAACRHSVSLFLSCECAQVHIIKADYFIEFLNKKVRVACVPALSDE